MSRLKNISVRYKIILIASIGIVSFMLYFVFNSFVAFESSTRLSQVKDVSLNTLAKIDSSMLMVVDIKALYQDAVAAGEEDMVDEADALAKQVSSQLLDGETDAGIGRAQQSVQGAA